MGVAEQFVEAARLIASGDVYFTSTAAFVSGVRSKTRDVFYDIFLPHRTSEMEVGDSRQWRTMSLLFAAEMVKTGDLR